MKDQSARAKRILTAFRNVPFADMHPGERDAYLRLYVCYREDPTEEQFRILEARLGRSFATPSPSRDNEGELLLLNYVRMILNIFTSRARMIWNFFASRVVNW